MKLALVHAVTAALAGCELTFVPRQPIDVDRARSQHDDYCRLLATLGLRVRSVATSPEHPDAVFVEDCAVVVGDRIVATRMGVASRAAEVERLLPVLAGYGPVHRLAAPAVLEGGDVLQVQRTLYVGLSPRTNEHGIEALARLLAPSGHRVVPVPVHGCLHLKTAVTALADDTLLANPNWVDMAAFDGLRVVPVDAGEPFAGNVLRLGDAVVASATHHRTNARLRQLGFVVHTVGIDELEKAEAGVTCLSLILSGAG